ncbi:MAG: cupin domain-containing protein [Bacteroidales bacterium]|nr:cupin domain-containing protein [Bacteroidales bacterium]MCF8405254.1 cupin domain-containing protein [Bacteroidales bacterium]
MKLVHTNQLKEEGTSHDDAIKKKVFIKRGYIPQLMMFSSATLMPGQSVETHKHDTMFEVYYIQKGKAMFVVNDEAIELKPGDCISIEPGENHSTANPYSEEVTWLYFGIATD